LVKESSSGIPAPVAAETTTFFDDLFDGDPQARRSALDERHRAFDEVLAGRRRAVIYPAARMAREAAARLKSLGVHVVAFGDGNPAMQGSHIDGLPVLSPAEVVAAHRGDVVLIASTMHDSAINRDLLARGCEAVVPVGYLNLRLPGVFRSREYDGAFLAATDPANRPAIEKVFALLADSESRRVFASKLAFYVTLEKPYLDGIRSPGTIYFDPSVYTLGSDEIVADGGAFVGDTLASFLGCSSGRFRGYIAFEPDPESYAKLSAVAATDPARISAVRAGLAFQESSARFRSTHGADSRLLGEDELGGDRVPVVSLDGFFAGREAPTLIKMDIEGAEADALQGAGVTLRSAAPTLAISVYHFPTDLWTIPLLINRLMPSGRLYLRHYTNEIDDTVCYAVPPGRHSTT
jgi:FkbM family methyltransferase